MNSSRNGQHRGNVFEDGMQFPIAAAIGLGLLFQPNLPLAHFTGKIHGTTKKQVIIDTEEGNQVEFAIDRKTRIQRGNKNAAASDLKTGDSVAIEARQEMLGYLVAVTITAEAKPER